MIWGLQQVILKMAAPDISPIMQIALRSGLAAVLVLPLCEKKYPTFGTRLFAFRAIGGFFLCA
jgi:drug/metabolite transporter (DMT)-like permease